MEEITKHEGQIDSIRDNDWNKWIQGFRAAEARREAHKYMVDGAKWRGQFRIQKNEKA